MTDKMMDIASNEDFLMDSLRDFKPPDDKQLLNKSGMTAVLENNLGPIRDVEKDIVGGLKMKDMVDDNQDDL